jgi:hypothetical protein
VVRCGVAACLPPWRRAGKALQEAVVEAATTAAAENDLVERIGVGIARLVRSLPDAKGQAALGRFLVGLGRVGDPGHRALVISFLGEIPGPRSEETLIYLLVTAEDPRVEVAAVQALGQLRSERAIHALIDRLDGPHWPLRSAAIWALSRVGPAAASAVDALIDLLEREDGRLREDAARALEKITGRRLGPYPGRWRAYQKARDAGDDSRLPGESRTGDPVPTFYGIQTRSKRIVFVLDRSGSMRDASDPTRPDEDRTKLALMKRELRQMVAALPDDAQVNLVVYHHGVDRLDPRHALMPLGPTGRKRLSRFLERVDAVGATNIYDALKAAFRLAGLGASDRRYEVGVDTIFFLTDGNPTQGEILDPERIRLEVRRWNRLRRIRVHVIGVGRDVKESFLRGLAEDSGGQFVKR